ncbi:hypothetical protein AMR42_13560 [Limnothrix sp. PR1529]|uniref:hypothetical protein n=1 Tax=Limnothrix sp. PR1529 TaxID=1704291 RepID=UPI00081E3C7B|nr:hypothetical protein [Limnothrix sp. PR1529]OCQ98080.1 hypothetical protein BCR12_08715 [Limnothrix sp. P13C2]PIB08500.1 hypothetical protein AMR42_13560 [Limnothrix sp. PR1529]
MANRSTLLEVVADLLKQAQLLTDLAESSIDLAQTIWDTDIEQLPGLIEQIADDCDSGIAKVQAIVGTLDETRAILGLSSGSLAVMTTPVAIVASSLSSGSNPQTSPHLTVETDNPISNTYSLITPEITPEELTNFEADLNNAVDGMHQLLKSVGSWSTKTVSTFTIMTTMYIGALNRQAPTIVESLRHLESFFGLVERASNLSEAIRNPSRLQSTSANELDSKVLEDLSNQMGSVMETDTERKTRKREEELDEAAQEQAKRDRTPGASP